MRVWRRFGPLLAIVLVLLPLLALAPVSLPPDGGVQEANAAPTFRLPWKGGQRWLVTEDNSSANHNDPAFYPSLNRFAFDVQPLGADPTVVAIAGGTVIAAVNNVQYSDDPNYKRANSGGNCVAIEHEPGVYSAFAHMETGSIAVAVGQRVEAGQPLGRAGRTGYVFASSPLLHWTTTSTKPDSRCLNGLSSQSRYADVGGDGIPRKGNSYTSENYSGPSCAARPLQVTTALTVVPGDPRVGDRVDASFIVTNTADQACPALTSQRIGVGGRGPGGDPDVQDFRIDENVTIGPGQAFDYSASRSFSQAGQHTFSVAAQDTSGAWYTVASSNTVTIQVQAPLPTATPAPTSVPPLQPTATPEPTMPPEPADTAVAVETAAPEPPPAVETTAPEPPPVDGNIVDVPVGIERCVTDPEAVPLLRAIDPTPDGLITTDELSHLAATMDSAELQALAGQAATDGTAGYRYDGICNAAGGGDVNVPPAENLPPAESPEPEDALAAAVRAAVPTGVSANDGTVDRDGVVCLVLEEGAAAAIASVDADADGTITLAEARAVAPDNVDLQQAVDTAAARGITGFRYQGCGAPAVAMTPPATTALGSTSAPVTDAGAPPPASGEEAAMISGSDGDAVNCRAAANVESAVVARLPEGTVVVLNGPAIGGWQPIICDGQPGYVATAFLATVSAQVSAAATPTAGEPESVAIQSSDGGAPVDVTQPPATEPPSQDELDPPQAPPTQVAAGQQSSTESVEEPVAAGAAQPSPLTIVSATDSEQSPAAADAIDGDPATSWSVVPQVSPRQVELTLDLGQPQPVGRLELVLASDAILPPAEIRLSMDGATWWNLASFDPALVTPNPDGAHAVPLGYTARFVRLVVLNVGSSGIPEVGGVVEATVWPADGEVLSLQTIGVPVTPVPAPVETQAAPVGGDESPAAVPPTAAAEENAPADAPGNGSDPPQVIEAEPEG